MGLGSLERGYAMTVRSFDAPDETRGAGTGSVAVVNLDSATVARISFPSGWRWSEDVKPIAGTERCQAHHVGHVVSGRLRVEDEGGSTFEVGPGDVYEIAPGHDAWVLGDDGFVGLEFQSQTAQSFAKS
jgi:hypothetical protein